MSNNTVSFSPIDDMAYVETDSRVHQLVGPAQQYVGHIGVAISCWCKCCPCVTVDVYGGTDRSVSFNGIGNCYVGGIGSEKCCGETSHNITGTSFHIAPTGAHRHGDLKVSSCAMYVAVTANPYNHSI